MATTKPVPEQVDLLVVGGGVNGAGIARDAVGRGLSVILCEKDDLAQGTSSRSGKYIHGGLRYLEYYEFRLVREALIEREVLLETAPHITWPLRLVLPHTPEQRPAWLVRLGLLLYDNLGGRKRLPRTRALDLRTAPEGRALRDQYTKGFEYSDCWVDDSRLVLLNALDAAARGAAVLTRTAVTNAAREGALWSVELTDTVSGERRTVRARCLANAAGPWVEKVLGRAAGVTSKRRVRLVKGSHIVTKKFWDGQNAYVLQNHDKRLIFINPYQGDLTLCGTTDIPYEGRPEDVKIDDGEIAYLLEVMNRYFKHQLTPADIVHSFSGVRPLYDDAQANPSAVTRDYVFEVDGGEGGKAPIISAFGGKITTYRKLAEHALDKLRPFFPEMGKPWTATGHLPGGDMPDADPEAYLAALARRHPWLPAPLARHYVRLYGTRLDRVVGGARSTADLGRHFGGLLYEREARYLCHEEWAMTAEDVLERRTKHGLRLTAVERQAFADWMGDQVRPRAPNVVERAKVPA
ncbi:MAG TPA: glycerol-3-phosphate dehydrogenase [Geminicoccaceae bacterium]